MKHLKAAATILGVMLATAPCLAQAESKNEILIKNGPVEVSSEDFEANILRIPQQDRFEFRSNLDRINKVVNNIYVNRAMANEARKAGLDNDPLLKSRVRQYEEQLLATAQMEQLLAKADIPDFEVRARELYKAQPEKYTSKPMVHASHILIDTRSRSDGDALKRAQEARERALKGESFEALVQEFSDDPSAKKNNGDLGFFDETRMVKPFSEAAFALKQEGELSQPVKSQFGYHIIRLLEKKEGKLKDFEAVKPALIKELQDKYVAQLRKDTTGAILGAPEMKTYPDAILRLKTELPTAAPASSPAAN